MKNRSIVIAGICCALALSGCAQFFSNITSMGIYAVRFESNGGSAVAERRASLITSMPVPTKAGYGFAGWYADAALSDGAKASFPYDPLADVTLYAKWVVATDGLYYTEDGDAYTVWAGSATGNVTIPAWWQGKQVTSIGAWAFSGVAGLTSVVIPESVTSIGSGAFAYGTTLQNVEVKAATPPAGSSNMFTQCSLLTAISVPAASVAAYQAADAWNGYAAKIVGNTLSFGSYAVTLDAQGGSAVASLTTSYIADPPVSSLAGKALEGWYTGPNGTGTKIAFPYDPLADITLYAKWIDATEGLSYAASGSGYSVSNSTATGAVTIPAYWRGKPVVAVESWAFSYFGGVTSVAIPASVTQIGASAFINCTGLASIALPAGLASIGDNAFKGSGLTSIEIPAAVTYIGHAAFYDCAALASVKVDAAAPPETFTNVFLNASNAVPAGLAITVPAGTEAAYDAAYGWNAYAAKISE